MRQPWSQVRRAMLALGIAGSFGFGVSQAFAVPAEARLAACPWSSSPYFYGPCETDCRERGYDFGYCANGSCVCRNLTPP